MDTLLAIAGYGLLAIVLVGVLGILLALLAPALLIVPVLLAIGFPIWLWVEYGWLSLVPLAAAAMTVRLPDLTAAGRRSPAAAAVPRRGGGAPSGAGR
jgi:hypothetical protein